MKLIVGLGNPGREYEKTRHNVGFYVLDSILGKVKWSTKFNDFYYEGTVNGEKYVFVKPLSYMNLSGGVVSSFMNFYKLDYKDLLVIQDDIDLPIGTFRIKINSSAGGHNGIKDIISHLHTDAFARVKVGVGHDKGMDTKDYVLGNLSKSDMKAIDDNLDSIIDIISNFDYDHIQDLMNKYN